MRYTWSEPPSIMPRTLPFPHSWAKSSNAKPVLKGRADQLVDLLKHALRVKNTCLLGTERCHTMPLKPRLRLRAPRERHRGARRRVSLTARGVCVGGHPLKGACAAGSQGKGRRGSGHTDRAPCVTDLRPYSDPASDAHTGLRMRAPAQWPWSWAGLPGPNATTASRAAPLQAGAHVPPLLTKSPLAKSYVLARLRSLPGL